MTYESAIATCNFALALARLPSLDSEDCALLRDPSADVEQVQGLLETLHRCGAFLADDKALAILNLYSPTK